MPNWCYNKLKVTGTKGEIAKLRKDLGDKPLSFNQFVPQPEGLVDRSSTDENTAMPDWYHWRLANWGTKWDLADDEPALIKDNANLLLFEFDTAWSPPSEWIYRMSQLYPKLTFTNRYEEEGNGFRGRYIAKGGEVEEDSCTDY